MRVKMHLLLCSSGKFKRCHTKLYTPFSGGEQSHLKVYLGGVLMPSSYLFNSVYFIVYYIYILRCILHRMLFFLSSLDFFAFNICPFNMKPRPAASSQANYLRHGCINRTVNSIDSFSSCSVDCRVHERFL